MSFIPGCYTIKCCPPAGGFRTVQQTNPVLLFNNKNSMDFVDCQLLADGYFCHLNVVFNVKFDILTLNLYRDALIICRDWQSKVFPMDLK